MTIPTPGWRDQAPCVGDYLFDAESGADAQMAARICHGCPVALDCLEAALSEETGDSNNRSGIRGGLTPKQRVTIARRRRTWAAAKAEAEGVTVKKPMRGPGRPEAPCGTQAAYDRHIRRHELVDDACREAHAEKRRKQRARDRGPAPCGTRRGYRRHRQNGEPACDACRYANAAADRRLRTTGTTLVLA